MIKGLLVSFNFIGILFYSLFFAPDINVTQTLPSTLQAGEEVTVEVTITKGDVSDFAQVKLEIPDGITISEKDNKGASFTFKDGTARWVWYSLPSDEQFTFKYKLSADEGSSGDKTLKGKFSYVVDNNPQSFVFEDHTISIGAGESTAEANDGGAVVVDDPPANTGEPATYNRILNDQGDGTYLVRLQISKGGISGFGRAKDLIPDGFRATKGETKGAIFSFVDQNAKFIWTELPAEDNFEVTYTLKADPGTTGNHSITGEFSYLVDEETREASAGATSIAIESNATADTGNDAENTTDTGNNTDTGNDTENTAETGDDNETNNSETNTDAGNDTENTADAGNDNETNTETGNNDDPKSAVEVSCERTITKQSDDRFKVEVIINKSTANGFARLKEDVPAGFTAVEGESASGRFSFKDNAVKYVWTMLPAAEQLTITYFLQAEGDISGNFDLNGTFSYVEDNDTKKVNFGPTAFEVTPPAIADTGDTGDATDTGDVTDTGDATDTGDVSDTGDTGNNGDANNNGTNDVVSTPNAENGITYRVQILAAHKVVADNFFSKKYNYSGNVNTENHQGWVKYTVGSHQQYKAARDERENITNAGHDFPGPFVAAYNDGARTTVQEALMVSNQQWYK